MKTKIALPSLKKMFAKLHTEGLETPLPLCKRYLSHRNDVRTAEPVIAFATIDEFKELFGVNCPQASKPHDSKPMTLTLTEEPIEDIHRFSLMGKNIQLHAVIKRPEGRDMFHLDAFQVVENSHNPSMVTDIPCGKDSIKDARLQDFIACFKMAAATLWSDPSGYKGNVELILTDNLQEAVMAANSQNPSPEQVLGQRLKTAFYQLTLSEMLKDVPDRLESPLPRLP